jgi:ADP-heptose:LPS heptosyltransferase
LIFHPRNKAIGDFRSWHPNNWQELVDALCSNYSIAVIGNAAAFCPNNTSDFRGISLEDLCNLIVQTKLVVGPSSGPMHFAALCGKKHLVWSAAHNRARYERVWNPFNTDVIFVDEFEWTPPVSAIEKIIRDNVPPSLQ